ncbi:MAG: Fe-S cluster assembly protein SufD [Pantoea sp. Brub]|nr:Fe-S cluster assembly protein SufD [Pantoea sp. Brub]
MDGLLKSNDPVLNKWYELFKINNNSNHAQKHWNHLINLGIPTNKHENWKYFPLNNLLSQKFILPTQEKPLNIEEINKLAIPIDSVRIIFVNGIFQSSLSSIDTEIFKIKHNDLNQNIKLPLHVQSEIFLHLTESLVNKISIISIEKNITASKPLYILHINSGQKKFMNMIHYRHHLQLGKNSKIEVIEHYVSLNSNKHFTGSRFTFNIGNNASLKHTNLIFEKNTSYHFSHNDIIIGDNSKVISNTFLLGSNVTRHNNSIQLNGKYSKLVVNSLSLSNKNIVSDTRTYLEHNQGYCFSRQMHKTVVFDYGHAIFNGHIKVNKKALQTDGQMINKNLLLGKCAEVNTKPQLEIYADDVKCSHGVTVSYIDKEHIFYLRSRGISKNNAKQMIIDAFIVELIKSLDNDVLRYSIFKHLSILLSKK